MAARKLYSANALQKIVVGSKTLNDLGVTMPAFNLFKKDLAEIVKGKLKSPSETWVFVWDAETGQRFLFRGKIDEPAD